MARDRDEPVRLTKIYTRGGDQGETSLGDGSRASKRDPRIGAYGSVDELNSLLGVALEAALPDSIRAVLMRVQNEPLLPAEVWKTRGRAARNFLDTQKHKFYSP